MAPLKERTTDVSQSSWNGMEKESPGYRIGIVTTPHPRPELLQVFGGKYKPDATLSMVVDGKQIFVTLNRRELFHLASQCFASLSNMEPGQ